VERFLLCIAPVCIALKLENHGVSRRTELTNIMIRLASTLWLSALVLICCGTSLAKADETEKAAEKITYADHVRPILREHCFSCHNKDNAENDLVLDSYAGLMTGGAGGAVVEPGDPDASRIYLLISHQESPEMPPEQDKLPDETLAVVRAWIAGGVLENTGSKAVIKNKPKIDLTMTAGSEKPTGEAAFLTTYRASQWSTLDGQAPLRPWRQALGPPWSPSRGRSRFYSTTATRPS